MGRSKKNKGLVTPSGWTITEAGRRSGAHYMRERRARRNQSLLWVLRLLIALVVLAGASPYLRNEDIDSALASFLNYRPAAPVNPGDQNGLLHK
jgi:hypothetical protein